MIRVTVEYVSTRGAKRTRLLGTAELRNTGEHLVSSNYDVRLSRPAPGTERTWRTGRVVGFDRERRGPWDLLLRALVALAGDRNREACETLAALEDA